MKKISYLSVLLYINIFVLLFILAYKLYFHFSDTILQANNFSNVNAVEQSISDDAYKFAVLGNINNSIGIFQEKIIPQLNASNIEFVVSTGNAVSGGGEDKYRALARSLQGLEKPFLAGFGVNENSFLGSHYYYDYFGPYFYTVTTESNKLIFLDTSGKSNWSWQLQWLEQQLKYASDRRVFVFMAKSIKASKDKIISKEKALEVLHDDYLLMNNEAKKLMDLFNQYKIAAVFTTGLPISNINKENNILYVHTGGAGGFILNTDNSYYHYMEVTVDANGVDVVPIQFNIDQHYFSRLIENTWFFIHSLLYVGLLNYLVIFSLLIILTIILYRRVWAERNYYPDYTLPINNALPSGQHIAMFCNSFLPLVGGVPISIDRLRKSLSRLGHSTTVVAPHYNEPVKIASDEKGVLRVPRFFSWGKDKIAVSNIFQPKLLKTLIQMKPDIVHIHDPVWIGTLGRLIAKFQRIPLVYTYHTRLEQFDYAVPLPAPFFRNYLSHLMIARFSNRCDAVVVPTESAEYYLRNIGVRSDIFVIPTSVDFERFQQIEQQKVIRIKNKYVLDDGIVLICVARLSSEKNIAFVIDAIAQLSRQYFKPFKLLIVGDGPDREYLTMKVSQLQLDDIVILTGNIPPADITEYYAAADIFVFGSQAETQGMVILEAMAAGLPVVAVRSSGIDEFVINGQNGFKTQLNTIEIANSLQQLMENHSMITTLSNQARQLASRYSLNYFGDEMVKVYGHVMTKKKGH